MSKSNIRFIARKIPGKNTLSFLYPLARFEMWMEYFEAKIMLPLEVGDVCGIVDRDTNTKIDCKVVAYKHLYRLESLNNTDLHNLGFNEKTELESWLNHEYDSPLYIQDVNYSPWERKVCEYPIPTLWQTNIESWIKRREHEGRYTGEKRWEDWYTVTPPAGLKEFTYHKWNGADMDIMNFNYCILYSCKIIQG